MFLLKKKLTFLRSFCFISCIHVFLSCFQTSGCKWPWGISFDLKTQQFQNWCGFISEVAKLTPVTNFKIKTPLNSLTIWFLPGPSPCLCTRSQNEGKNDWIHVRFNWSVYLQLLCSQFLIIQFNGLWSVKRRSVWKRCLNKCA